MPLLPLSSIGLPQASMSFCCVKHILCTHAHAHALIKAWFYHYESMFYQQGKYSTAGGPPVTEVQWRDFEFHPTFYFCVLSILNCLTMANLSVSIVSGFLDWFPSSQQNAPLSRWLAAGLGQTCLPFVGSVFLQVVFFQTVFFQTVFFRLHFLTYFFGGFPVCPLSRWAGLRQARLLPLSGLYFSKLYFLDCIFNLFFGGFPDCPLSRWAGLRQARLLPLSGL